MNHLISLPNSMFVAWLKGSSQVVYGVKELRFCLFNFDHDSCNLGWESLLALYYNNKAKL